MNLCMLCSQSAGNSNMLKILSTINFEGKTYSKPILGSGCKISIGCARGADTF